MSQIAGGVCTGRDGPRIGPYLVEYALGDAPRHDEYRLRYDVFVTEYQWISPDGLVDGEERDACDPASHAVLLRDAGSGEPVACQRLILPERVAPGILTNVELIAARCGAGVASLPRESWAEVSRTTIAPRFRQGSRTARAHSAIAALTMASLAPAVVFERHTLFSISDPRTARRTRGLGVGMRQIGEVVDFHGPRVLFRIDVGCVLEGLSADDRVRLDELVSRARLV